MKHIFFYDIVENLSLWKNTKDLIKYKNENIILEDYFYKSTKYNDIFKKKYFIVTENYLYYKNKKNSKKIKGITKIKWLKFLHKPEHNIFKTEIKIYKNNKYCNFYFFNKNYEKWLNYFNKNFINTNFHDKYEPIKIIGKGSFASIYLVRNKLNNQNFAIKAFGKNYLTLQKNGWISLKNEINLMRKFNHKNIIKIFEVHETLNSVYIVIELLNGGNLVKSLNYQVNTKDCYNIMKGLLSAVSYIHNKGIMHRDIKPENIVLKENCLHIKKTYIKLIDFGWATKINPKKIIYKKCGTPGFIAPEILNNESSENKLNYNEKCDIFSSGIILYILLKGKSPFFDIKQENILELNKKCKINFNDIKSSNSLIVSLLKGMLEINPQKRFSVDECLNHEFFYDYEKNYNPIKKVSIKLDNTNYDQNSNNNFKSLYFKNKQKKLKNKTWKKASKNMDNPSLKSNHSIKNRESIYKYFADNSIIQNKLSINNTIISTNSKEKFKNLKNNKI